MSLLSRLMMRCAVSASERGGTHAERSDVEPANARTEQAGDELVVQHATGDDRARKVDDRASLVVSKVRATDDAPPCRAG